MIISYTVRRQKSYAFRAYNEPFLLLLPYCPLCNHAGPIFKSPSDGSTTAILSRVIMYVRYDCRYGLWLTFMSRVRIIDGSIYLICSDLNSSYFQKVLCYVVFVILLEAKL